MTPRLKPGMIVGAFVALGAVAVTGWVRKPASPYAYNPEPTAAPAAPSTQAVNYAAGATSGAVAYDQYGQPTTYGQQAYGQPTYGQATYGSSSADYGAGSYVSSSSDACQYPPALPTYGSHHYVRTVRVRTEVVPENRSYTKRYYVEGRAHHRRSTGKSVAIVAGSAGVGAAIGAIAGGGKGAGIGALAGGAGGFIYDRLTHNR